MGWRQVLEEHMGNLDVDRKRHDSWDRTTASQERWKGILIKLRASKGANIVTMGVNGEGNEEPFILW